MRNRLISSFLHYVVWLVFISAPFMLYVNEGKTQESIPEQGSDTKEDGLDAKSIVTFTGAYLSGAIANADNELDQAIAFYRRALEIDGKNIEAQRYLFNSLLMAGDFDNAVKLAENFQDDPQIRELAQRTFAVQAIRKREYRSLDRFLNLDSGSPVDILLNRLLLAWAKFGDNKKDEAITLIIDLEGPPWYRVFKDFNIAMVAAASGNNKLAIKHFNRLTGNQDTISISVDTFLQGIMALATLHAQTGDKNKSLATLKSNGDISLSYPPAGALEKLIVNDADMVFPVKNAQEGASLSFSTLAGALNREGNEDIVTVYLQFSLALNPDNAPALIMLARLQEKLDRPEKAIEMYRTVPEHSPLRRLSELQLGLTLASIGQIDEALEHIAALIKAHPKDMRAYETYGDILSHEKRYQEMVDNYEAAIKAVGPVHKRSHWNLFYQLGIGYERLKIWEKAETFLLRALELSPEQPQVMNYLGYSWVDMNINLEKAMDMIRAAVNLRPNDSYFIDSLGWAHYRQGQYNRAIQNLEKAAELQPSDPVINDHLGDALWKAGRKTEAYFQWERALSNVTDFDEDLVLVIEKKLKEGLPEDKSENALTSDDD